MVWCNDLACISPATSLAPPKAIEDWRLPASRVLSIFGVSFIIDMKVEVVDESLDCRLSATSDLVRCCQGLFRVYCIQSRLGPIGLDKPVMTARNQAQNDQGRGVTTKQP